MKLSNYTSARAGKLAKRKIETIYSPTEIKTLWIRGVESHSGINLNFHKHSFHEAHFMISGHNTYEVNGKSYELGPREVIVIPSEMSHRIRHISDEFLRITIAFSVSFPTENVFLYPSGADFSEALEIILKEVDNKDALSDEIIKGQVLSMLSPYIRFICEVEKNGLTDPSEDLRITLVKRYINDNKNMFLDSENVANYCHFNVKYLNRIFKQETGQTLLEYIHDVKISEAERLMTETDLSLEDISEQLGFSNVQYFNTFFKRITSMTPGFYRNLAKKS